MTITALLDPTLLPSRTMDQAAFDAAMSYLMTNLPTWGAQVNAIQANLNSIAAGGAFAIPYTWRNVITSNGGTSGGIMSFGKPGSASGGSDATFVLLDSIAGGQNVAALLDEADNSSSAVKGYLKVVKVADVSKWIVFSFTLYTPQSSYYGLLNVTPVAYSSITPFTNGDAVIALFQRNGDKGDKGDTGATGSVLTGVLHVADIRSSGATAPAVSAGTTTRTLNTVVRNTIGGVAALASNQVTLPAGTYRVSGSAIAYSVGAHQAYLYNTTTSSNILAGTSEYSSGATGHSEIMREIVLATQSVIELRHWALSSMGNFGYPTSSGIGEVYAHLIFEKVA